MILLSYVLAVTVMHSLSVILGILTLYPQFRCLFRDYGLRIPLITTQKTEESLKASVSVEK